VFCGFFLKPVEKNHDIAFVENEKYAVNVTVVLHTDFKQPVAQKIDELCTHLFIPLEQVQNVVYFFRSSSVRVDMNCSKYPPYSRIFLFMVQNYMKNPDFPSACEMKNVFLQRKRT
jgi:hypothetical protein